MRKMNGTVINPIDIVDGSYNEELKEKDIDMDSILGMFMAYETSNLWCWWLPPSWTAGWVLKKSKRKLAKYLQFIDNIDKMHKNKNH